jgi:hypothetical protein
MGGVAHSFWEEWGWMVSVWESPFPQDSCPWVVHA